MSLKKNTIANYISQMYAVVIGIVTVPIYVKYMGLEAYGLVGFFAMLQSLFQLLDLGITPTISREVARFKGGAIDALTLTRVFYILECAFFVLGIIGAMVVVRLSGSIVHKWLKIEHLNLLQAQYSIMIMGVIAALRWASGLYKGAIGGFEHFVWLSNCSLFINTMRFVMVILVFRFLGASPIIFFCYQGLIAFLEFILVLIKKYQLMPPILANQKSLPWNWSELHKILKISLTIAFTTSVWILVTQADKLILSKILSLKEYACYTMAVLVAGGISILSGPISATFIPRITVLNAGGHDAQLIRLYRNTTQMVSVISIPVMLVFTYLSQQVLYIWTGDAQVAHISARVLALYVMGNGLLNFSAFVYFLQFAKGDLKLHFIGNVGIVLLYIPILILLTYNLGMIGAAYAWFFKNALFFIVWVPIVHHRFAKNLHMRWLLQDILKIAVLPLIIIGLSGWLVHWSENRAIACGQLIAVTCLMLVSSMVSSSFLCEKFSRNVIARTHVMR